MGHDYLMCVFYTFTLNFNRSVIKIVVGAVYFILFIYLLYFILIYPLIMHLY